MKIPLTSSVHPLEADGILHNRNIDRLGMYILPSDRIHRPADMVQEGESIRGELSCAPNARNNRDLDIVVDYEVVGEQATKGQMVYKM